MSLFASESSLRAARLQCGSRVPAEYFAQVEPILMLYSFLSSTPPPPFSMTHFPITKMPAVSQEEKEKRRKADRPLLLLKISLVKFSLSQRLAVQTQGLQGVRGRRGKARKTERKRKEGVGCVKQKHRERANSQSKAILRSPICA